MEGFELPPPDLLARSPPAAGRRTSLATRAATQTAASSSRQTLATFDIPARVEDWIAGPTVTLFEVEIAKGVKVNRVTALADDLALALAAPTVRILAPIPGKSLIGIEVPNERRCTVTLGDVLVGARVAERSPLLLGIGKDVSGERVIARPRGHAAPAHRRIDRHGQVGLHQRAPHVAHHARDPRRGAPHPHRPQAHRAVALQRRAAPLRARS